MSGKMISKRAQTTAEYAILIAIVVGAVVAMQIYVKRGLQGRVRDVVDYVDTGNATGNFTLTGDQYEPYYLTSTANTSQDQTKTENLQAGGGVIAGETSNVSVNRAQTTGW